MKIKLSIPTKKLTKELDKKLTKNPAPAPAELSTAEKMQIMAEKEAHENKLLEQRAEKEFKPALKLSLKKEKEKENSKIELPAKVIAEMAAEKVAEKSEQKLDLIEKNKKFFSGKNSTAVDSNKTTTSKPKFIFGKKESKDEPLPQESAERSTKKLIEQNSGGSKRKPFLLGSRKNNNSSNSNPSVVATDSSSASSSDSSFPVNSINRYTEKFHGETENPTKSSQPQTVTLHTPETPLNKNQITYDHLVDKQKEAVDLSISGQSICLIGPAGSGKTTTQRIAVESLRDSLLIGNLEVGTKRIPTGAPAIAILSFTNKAVENIRDAVPNEFKNNCLTIHKILEYAPEKVEKIDPENGEVYFVKEFKPQRNSNNPLPHFDYIIIEEGSNVGIQLFANLVKALPNPKKTKFIFLGDLNQLPPVMDIGILGFALSYLPVVELNKVHRTGNQSPITEFAHIILAGKGLTKSGLEEKTASFNTDEFKLIPFQKYLEPSASIKHIGTMFKTLVETGKFTIEDSVVLIPFNGAGSVNVQEMNRYLAQGVTTLTQNPVYEIIAGFSKYYFSEGDILYANSSMWKITSIEPNPKYEGLSPLPETIGLDRWGKVNQKDVSADDLLAQKTIKSIKSSEELFEEMSALAASKRHTEDEDEDEDDSRKNQASHIVHLVSLDDDEITSSISKSAEFNKSSLGYALTINKSQGSEWKNVYCIFCNEHSKMLKRELTYTAVTRARKKLVILYQPEFRAATPQGIVKGNCSFQNGIINQVIAGKTLDSKLAYYSEKLSLAKIKLKAKARSEAIQKHNDKSLTDKIYNELWYNSDMRTITNLLENHSIKPENTETEN